MIEAGSGADGYGRGARIFHWLSALIVLGLVVTGFVADWLPRGPARAALFDIHRGIGTFALPLVAARLAWRAMTRHPAELNSIPRWQRRAAAATHVYLYASLFAQPLSGILMYTLDGEVVSLFGLASIPAAAEPMPSVAGALRTFHEVNALILAAALVAHVSAALWHHFVQHDDVLIRMVRGRIR